MFIIRSRARTGHRITIILLLVFDGHDVGFGDGRCVEHIYPIPSSDLDLEKKDSLLHLFVYLF